MNFKDYIKTLRENNDLTQEKAAELLEVTPTTIANWEKGRCKPEYGIIKNIAEKYNVKVNEILQYIVEEEQEINNEHSETERIEFFKKLESLLPFECNLSKLHQYNFTKDEQELFLTIMADFMLRKIESRITINIDSVLEKNAFRLITILKKLQRLGITKELTYNSYGVTQIACLILEYITKRNNSLFNIIDLNFSELLELMNAMEIIKDEGYRELMALNKINSQENGVLALDSIKPVQTNKHRRWEEPEYVEQLCHLNENGNYYINSSNGTLKDILVNYNLLDYVEIYEEELDTESYRLKKKAYLEQKEHYEKYKDSIGNVTKPKFEEVYIEYVKLSEKGKSLFALFEN